MKEGIDCLVPEDQQEVMKKLREVTGEHCSMNTSLSSKSMEGEGAGRNIIGLLEDTEVLVTITMGDADCSYKSALVYRFEHHMGCADTLLW